MGLDHEKKMLYFVNQQEQADTVLRVPLADARLCILLVNDRSVKGELTDARTERVELSFAPKAPGASEHRLLLYRETLGSFPNGEPQLAAKWAALLNAMI